MFTDAGRRYAPHAGFIAEQDQRARLLRHLTNRRKFLLAPAPNPLRVLFGGAIKLPLTTQTQLTQQPAHAGDDQLQRERFPRQHPDRPATPQRELKAQL
jgi:hypothetical protein